MKLSNERLLNDAQGLSGLTGRKLPIKASYAIAKNIAKIQLELNIYDAERAKVIEKYSIKDENGKTKVDEENKITIQDEFLEIFNKEIQELKEIENDIDIHKFSISGFDGGDYDITPGEFMLIDYMIEE